MTASPVTDGDARAWGWVEHLQSGGTTPWAGWSGPGPAGEGPLPGAQQLELLRRLNLVGPVSRDLAARVLRTPAAGRGRADLPLAGAGAPAFGPRPVDPADLDDRELVRVASVLLAEDLVALGADPVPTSWTRPWRLRFRLLGDPLVVARVGDDLQGRGRPQGGVRPFVVVVAAPLDELLAHTWTQRCFERGTRPWEEWLRFWSERDQLPARVELGEAVRRWSRWRPFVRIVTDRSRLPHALGVRRVAQTVVPGADQAELARRVAAVVGLLVPAEERPALMRTLGARMPATSTPPVAVPAWARPWVDTAAQRVTRDLRRADYPVLGDLADLAPRWGAAQDPSTTAPAAPAGAELDRLVLALALRMLVDPSWQVREGEVSR
ncbi:MAG: hypothetical protein LT071_03245 [Nocardioides sp.]|nr:hypothetical protein [Nocardioides sp.]